MIFNGRLNRFAQCGALVLLSSGAFSGSARAVEMTMMLYSLGSGALGAGQTAPDGFYFSTIGVYNQWRASKDVPIGGLTLKANVSMPVMLGSMMFVVPDKILGGRLSVTATGGVGNIAIDAGLQSANIGKSTQGWGGTDSSVKVALGWDVAPSFSHKISVTTFLPTGRYDKGFHPNVGLNRFGADISWGATYLDPKIGFEISGSVGYTLEGYNGLTAYRSGNAVHFEEGIAQHFGNGFRIGVLSYQYTQTSADGGAGANLGPLRTRVVGVGASLGYTTVLGGRLVVFSAQATRDVATADRMRGTGGVVATTVKF